MTGIGAEDMMEAYRKLLGQWETLANDFGTSLLQRPETNQALHSMTNVNLQMQAQMKEAMEKALHTLQVPSLADLDDLNGRITAIEAGLARIETMLAGMTGQSAQTRTTAPRPRRTRKPESGQ